MATPKSNPLPLSLQHELNELADEILGLLLLAEAAQNAIALERVQLMFDERCQQAKAIGFRAFFYEDEDGRISVGWESLEDHSVVTCGACGSRFPTLHAYGRHVS